MGKSVLDNTINLAERFAYSDSFKKLFADGMTLVEEAAAYLDGDGREAAKTLSRSVAVFYGSESMRLTTRLMQLASWLLLQRAASEGEMTREQLLDEKKKVTLDDTGNPMLKELWPELPAEFQELVKRCAALQSRIIQLDRDLYGEQQNVSFDINNPVGQQIDLLSTAFGAKKAG